MKNPLRLTLAFFSYGLLFACTTAEDVTEREGYQAYEVLSQSLTIPETPYNYSSIDLPPYFNSPPVRDADNTPRDNQLSDDGVTLGRVLFYDKKLSANNTVSCSSCHVQANAFSDPVQFSTGFEGGKTARNSMGLSNARYYGNGHFFWDERAASLEEQTLIPIQDHIEMGLSLDELVDKLQDEKYYEILFYHAFGDSAVSAQKVSLALSQFVRAMVPYQSKYDKGLAQLQGPPSPQQDIPGFSLLENQGRHIFFDPAKGNCVICHGTELFLGREARNNGLDLTTTDLGLAAVTSLSRDEGKFKVPSLRNIEMTASYMHDGRFATLEEVVEHYNSGVKNHPNVHNSLKNPATDIPKKLNLSTQDKQALVAFLKTLTDVEFVSDEKFSDPFLK